MQVDLSALSKLSLRKQCESIGMLFEELIVPRGTRRASRVIPLLIRVKCFVVKHFESMGYEATTSLFFTTELEELILTHCRHMLDLYKPLGVFEDEIKKEVESNEAFDAAKIYLIGMNEWKKTLNKHQLHFERIKEVQKKYQIRMIDGLLWSTKYRHTRMNYFAHLKVLREDRANYIYIRNASRFSEEQLFMFLLIKNVPKSDVSILRAREKSIEETLVVSQESILVFEMLKKTYPSLITELDDKKNRLSVLGWKGKFDALIPELKLFLEYDGSYWHKEDVGSDLRKSQAAINEGYKVIRIRQEPLPLTLSAYDVSVPSKFDLSVYNKIVLDRINKVSEN